MSFAASSYRCIRTKQTMIGTYLYSTSPFSHLSWLLLGISRYCLIVKEHRLAIRIQTKRPSKNSRNRYRLAIFFASRILFFFNFFASFFTFRVSSANDYRDCLRCHLNGRSSVNGTSIYTVRAWKLARPVSKNTGLYSYKVS